MRLGLQVQSATHTPPLGVNHEPVRTAILAAEIDERSPVPDAAGVGADDEDAHSARAAELGADVKGKLDRLLRLTAQGSRLG